MLEAKQRREASEAAKRPAKAAIQIQRHVRGAAARLKLVSSHEMPAAMEAAVAAAGAADLSSDERALRLNVAARRLS